MIWEPACGDGAIVRVLTREGYQVIASDLHDHCGEYHSGPEFDFLRAPVARASTIVTNPPFNSALDFIVKAHALGVQRMALLLKADFWSAKRHSGIFALWPPALILVLTWRLDFTGAGAPHTNCLWCLWDADKHYEMPFFALLHEPELSLALGDLTP